MQDEDFPESSKRLVVIDRVIATDRKWVEGMEDTKIPVKVIGSPDDLLEQIPELTAGYDYVIVDGPASLSEATRAILFRSDLRFYSSTAYRGRFAFGSRCYATRQAGSICERWIT